MNKLELKNALEKSGIRPDSYSLNGGTPNECYCMDEVHDTWLVYYSERGLMTGKKEFSSEHEACEYLLEKIINDPLSKST